MPNSIELAHTYQPLLDELFRVSSKSAILDAPPQWIRATAQADTVLIPKMVLQGLGDYSRATGYVAGTATFSWESHTFTQDRGRSLTVDAQDDEETLNVALTAVTGQFVRTRVVPEVDAYRFAKLFEKAGTHAHATLDHDTVLPAIDVAREKLIEAEVDLANVVLFISPACYTFLKNNDKITRDFVGGNINRDIEIFDGMAVVQVPQNRFYSSITTYDGSTGGEEDGGFIKTAVTGLNLNFLMVDTNSVLGITKTALPRLFDPMTNQDMNAWKFDYRLYHDLFVPDNKVNGIYAHTVGE